jgi:hypothetical protein
VLLKNLTDKLVDEVISELNIHPNSSVLVGNNMYSTQFSYSNDQSLSETDRVALANKLSIIDADECFNTLKQFYNISSDKDLLISKTDINSYLNLTSLDEPLRSNNVQVKIYNPTTREELNITLCNYINIKIPIKSKELLNLTYYKKVNDTGIDVYNPNSDAFTSSCFSYIDNTTNYDTTLNYRRNHYYLNKSAICRGSDCTYETIDENDYVTCNCTNIKHGDQVYNDFVSYVLGSLSNWNFFVITCSSLILPVYKPLN